MKIVHMLRNRRGALKPFALGLAAMLLVGGSARAELITTDGFDTGSGTTVGDQYAQSVAAGQWQITETHDDLGGGRSIASINDASDSMSWLADSTVGFSGACAATYLNTKDGGGHAEVSFYDNTGITLAVGDKISVSFYYKGPWMGNDYGDASMPLSVSLVCDATSLSLDSFSVNRNVDWTARTTSEVTIDTAGTYHVKFVVSSTANDSSQEGQVFLDSVAYDRPVVADAGTSTVSANPTTVASDGVSASTITVILKDASNNPVSGKTVTLARNGNTGGGTPTISGNPGTTDAGGIATFTVTCATAGDYDFEATDTSDGVTVAAKATVTFEAGAVSAAHSTVSAAPTSVTADGTSTSTITVTLKDASNTPVAGKTVTLASSRAAMDSISAASGLSDVNGVVTFTVTSTTAGAPVFTATGDGVTLSSTPTVTFTAGPVDAGMSTVAVSPPTVAADGSATSTITVTLKDAYNNPVDGKDVSLAHTSGPGTPVITTVSGTTSASGEATFTVKSVTAGEDVFTATDDTDSLEITETATVTFVHVAAVTWAETPLDVSTTATGLEIANDGTLMRAYHFGYAGVITDITVHGVLFTNGGSAENGLTDTAMGGAWVGGWSGWNGDWSLASIIDPDYNQLISSMIMASSSSTITLGGLTAGHTYRLQLISNNPRNGQIDVEGNSHTLSGGDNANPVLLTATWVAGDDTLNMSMLNSDMHFNAYALHDMTPAPSADAGASTVSANPTTVANDGVTASTITVTLKDATSAAVQGKTVTLASSRPSDDTISEASGPSSASGVVTFSVTSASAGMSVFTATDTSDSPNVVVTQTATVTFVSDAVSVANSTVTADPTSVAADGSATSTITVTLKNANNVVLSGKAVTLAKTSGPGSPVIDPSAATTDGSGVATFTVKSTTAGADVFTAMADSVAISQTATVTFTAGAVSAGTSTVVASPATVPADGIAASTVTVTLLDANSNPLTNMTVSLASSRGGADTISDASGPSSASGVVTFTVKSTTAGVPVFTATGDSVALGTTPGVTFTAVSAADSTVTASPTSVADDGIATATVTVTLKDASGNPFAGKTVSLAHTSGSGTPVITTVSGTSSTSGEATFTVKSVTAGVDVFTATDVTDSLEISQTATVTFVHVTAVTWAETPLDVSTTATGLEIANDGTLMRAYHFGYAGVITDITVHGVLFTNGGSAENGLTDTAMGGTWVGGWSGWNGDWSLASIIDPDYNQLISSMIMASSSSTITLGGLTAGHTYRLQLISNNPRNGQIDVEGNSHTLSGGDNANPVLLTATWVAGDDTLNMSMLNSDMHFNAYALHDMTPAPSADAGASTVSANPTTVASDGVTASTITVTLKDATSAAVQGKTVTLASSRPSDDTISEASGPSSASGVVTFSVTSTSAGISVFTATDTSDSPNVVVTQTATVTFVSDAVSVANSTVTADPTSVAADGSATSTITVTLKNANNVVLSGKTVTLAKTSGPGNPTITTIVGTTDGSGIATFTVKSITAGADVFTGTGDSVELTTKTVTVTFTAGAVDAGVSAVVAAPTTVPADGIAASTVTVTLKDVNGNPVTNKTVTLVSDRGVTDTVSPASGPSSASGAVTFTVKSTTAGVPVFTATGDGVTLATTATVTFTAVPATITWGAATNDTLNGGGTAFLETDVKINGAFVAAVCNGGAGTVNGVTFTGWSSYNTAGTYLITYGASPITMQWAGNRGDPNWGSPSSAFGNFGYDNGTNNKLLLTGGGEGLSPGTITLSSLVVGNIYQVQIWAPTWNQTFTISVGGVNVRVGNPPGTLSQYVVGTFTANGDTQPIIWSGIAPSAISLRDVTPFPGTVFTFR